MNSEIRFVLSNCLINFIVKKNSLLYPQEPAVFSLRPGLKSLEAPSMMLLNNSKNKILVFQDRDTTDWRKPSTDIFQSLPPSEVCVLEPLLSWLISWVSLDQVTQFLEKKNDWIKTPYLINYTNNWIDFRIRFFQQKINTIFNWIILFSNS